MAAGIRKSPPFAREQDGGDGEVLFEVLYLGAETLRCAEQVTRIGDDFLGLLQCTQVEERDFEAGLIILDALEKRSAPRRRQRPQERHFCHPSFASRAHPK